MTYTLKKLEDLKKGDKLYRITERCCEVFKGVIKDGETSLDTKENLFNFGGFVCTKKVMYKMFLNDGGLFRVFV